MHTTPLSTYIPDSAYNAPIYIHTYIHTYIPTYRRLLELLAGKDGAGERVIRALVGRKQDDDDDVEGGGGREKKKKEAWRFRFVSKVGR